MTAKTAWQAVRVITLLGGLLLLPAMAMVGPGRRTPWAYWIWEGSLGVKLASAREPFELGPVPTGPSYPGVKDQLFDQNNHALSQNPSWRGVLEPTPPRYPPGTPSAWGGKVSTATPDSRDFPLLDPEERRLGVLVPWKAPSRNPTHRRTPGIRNRVPEASPLSGGTNHQTVSSDTAVLPSELLGCQKDCSRLGRYWEQLGATEYSVEYWDPTLGVYRAWCRVKVLPNSSLWTRHFEATGCTAAEALAKVAEQVVQWRERSTVWPVSP